MLVAGRFLSNGWRKSVTLRVKSVKDYHQTLQTPQYQLLKEIMATYVCCVMLRLNIQTTSVGIKSYVKKVKSHCLPVMYATSNSNLNIIGGAQASSYQNSFCFQHLLKVFQEERPPKKSQGSM